MTILGRPLVIWFDRNTSEWNVFHDLCPHRCDQFMAVIAVTNKPDVSDSKFWVSKATHELTKLTTSTAIERGSGWLITFPSTFGTLAATRIPATCTCFQTKPLSCSFNSGLNTSSVLSSLSDLPPCPRVASTSLVSCSAHTMAGPSLLMAPAGSFHRQRRTAR